MWGELTENEQQFILLVIILLVMALPFAFPRKDGHNPKKTNKKENETPLKKIRKSIQLSNVRKELRKCKKNSIVAFRIDKNWYIGEVKLLMISTKEDLDDLSSIEVLTPPDLKIPEDYSNIVYHQDIDELVIIKI